MKKPKTEPAQVRSATEPAVPTQPLHARVEGLRGVHGAMRLELKGSNVGSLHVDDGQVDFIPGDTQGDTVARFGDEDDARRLLRGELNPVVAGLQRRVVLAGNRSLGARIMLGLRTGASFSQAR